MRTADTRTCKLQRVIKYLSCIKVNELVMQVTKGVQKVYQSIHGTSFLVVLKTRSFLSGNINKTRKLVSFSIKTPIASKKHLNHARMILSVVSWPWCPILHNPSSLRNFLGFCNKCIDPNLKLFVFPLPFTRFTANQSLKQISKVRIKPY